MAATVSSVWAKPGAWALDSEQDEDELKQDSAANPVPQPPPADFPTLAAALSTKTKKKKPQTFSLAEFSSYGSEQNAPFKQLQRRTPDELLALPTGPRQRSAEELDRSRLGGGFRNYGGDSNYSRSRASDGGFGGNSGREKDTSFSRADEVDDWSKTKSMGFSGGAAAGGYERRERNSDGFFNSSRADDVDNWASNKSFMPSADGRRDRRTGFDSFPNGGSGGADSDNWTKKKEESFEGRRFERSGSGFDRERRGGGGGGGFEIDSEHWGKKKEERENGNGSSVGGVRPRLNLQPRTLPVNSNGQPAGTEGKTKGANPFGEARPREEVLAQKGKDWKEIEEKLESKKGEGFDGQGLRRRGFGMGRAEAGDDGRVERSWRKEDSHDARYPSAEKIEGEVGQVKIEDEVGQLKIEEGGGAEQED
ncbi:hypothetical protein Dimus_038183 [Dionaea muscipula]